MKPVRSAAGFEVAEQVDDRVGHPVLVGRRQFQDAMRMKIGVKDLVLKVLRGAVIDRFVDHTQEFTILLVEKSVPSMGNPEGEKGEITREMIQRVKRPF